jgi:hypothetical protein
MTRLLRFADLKARNIVRNWPSLKRLIQDQGFPPGIMLGNNTRAWDEAEVEGWIANRPTGGTPPKRAAE